MLLRVKNDLLTANKLGLSQTKAVTLQPLQERAAHEGQHRTNENRQKQYADTEDAKDKNNINQKKSQRLNRALTLDNNNKNVSNKKNNFRIKIF